MKKLFVFLVIVAVGGAVAWYGLAGHSRQSGPEQARRTPPATPVMLQTVVLEPIADVRTFSGAIESRTHFVVAPKIAGRLEQLTVRIGDSVKPGQLLAVLEDAEYLRQVEQARAELAVAVAGLEETRQSMAMAQRELERTVRLHASKIASEAELDGARTEFSRHTARQQVAEAQVEQRNAALKTAELRQAYTRIHVPEHLKEGLLVVAERYVDAGSLLSTNSPIVSIVDLAALVAVIHITEKEYFRIVPQQSARISSDGFAERVFTGRVTALAPMLKTTSRKARVEIELDDVQGLLKPGMFCRVEIEFDRRAMVPVVPLATLVHQNEQEGVFVADQTEGRAVFIPLELGLRNTHNAEVTGVLEPIRPPDRLADPAGAPPDLNFLMQHPVVVAGQHLLHDGAPIMITALDGEAVPNHRKPSAEAGRTP